MTPFKAVYGRDPPTLLPITLTDDLPADLHQQIQQRDQILDILKKNLMKAQARMKHFADRKRTEVQFERIGPVAYKLKLPETAKIHPVFHVSVLKRCESPTEIPYMPLPLLTDIGGPLLQPKAILDTRIIQKQDQWVPQVLLQWEGHDEPTWEVLKEFRELYPSFDLGDKVALEQGGDVTNHAKGGRGSHANQAQSEYEPKEGVRRSRRERRATWKLREI